MEGGGEDPFEGGKRREGMLVKRRWVGVLLLHLILCFSARYATSLCES